jgi:flagellar biosynthesis/type III secretory pathway M-ring protein FliF/YscJ
MFRALNEADAASDEMSASPAVEARLLAEVRAIARARRQRNVVMALAVAAAILVAVAISFWRSDQAADLRVTTEPAVHIGPVAHAAASRDIATDFMPLAFAYVPAFSTHIVRMVLPRRAMASFGLGSFELVDDAAATVTADVVIGEDGLARYIRFVRPAARQE